MRTCERCKKLVKVVRDSDDHTQWICDRCYFTPLPHFDICRKEAKSNYKQGREVVNKP